MIGNIDLNQLFLFPLKDNEARKNFLIAMLVYLTAFIIPILPVLVVIGYTARIMRQVVNGEEPHMPAWDDWESMLKDGLYIFGVRIVYVIPLFLILFPLYMLMVFTPLFVENSNASEGMILAPFIIFLIAMVVIFPISLALGIILPAAEVHTAVQSDFAAGFRFREWWNIFRVNWTGFLLAYAIALAASMVLSTIIGFAMMTIILICILPLIMPAISAYLNLVMYAAFAYAYKEGKAKLQQPIADNQHAST